MVKTKFYRENPNDRSAKEIQHLGPATDFYKRLALECSGQQIAVDVFLLNSQYSDLATICTYDKEYVHMLYSYSSFIFQLVSVNSVADACITSLYLIAVRLSKWSNSKNA